MNIPKTVSQFAIKHQINLGRNEHYYFVRDPASLVVVDTTRNKNPTALNALALCRRYLARAAHQLSAARVPGFCNKLTHTT